MISRYTRPEMAAIWTDEKKFECWLAVELAADEAWAKLGHIPAEDVEKLKQNAKFDVDRIQEIEAVTHHDVIAFTRNVSESLGEEKMGPLWLDQHRRGRYSLWLSIKTS